MAVRSKRLWGPVAVGTSGGVIYTCPAGETALIKNIEGVGSGGLGGSVTFHLNGNGAGNVLHVASLGTGGDVTITDIFWVLQPGDFLRAQTSAGTAIMWGFGAELEGVAD